MPEPRDRDSEGVHYVYMETEEDDDDNDPDYYPTGEFVDEDDDDDEDEEEYDLGSIEEGEEDDDGGGMELARRRALETIQALHSRRFFHLIGLEQTQPSPPSQAVPSSPTPNENGMQLMAGSDFGSVSSKRKRSRQEHLLRRELGEYHGRGQIRACHQGIVQSYLPDSNADFIIEHDSHCYIGQFSEDGNFFYSCAQDMRVRMYDTSDPYDWKYYKTVDYIGGRWTITDASLSPDNKLLAYSSITSAVYLADTTPGRDDTLRLEFADGGAPHSMHSNSGILSVRFSGDGNELIVGAKDNRVYIYDIAAGRPILKLRGHTDEVNAVCFGDSSSPHIIYSGSDDTTIKVWDRRSISDGRAVGVFTGHTEGVTFVDSKGDGRYVLSNGKDQEMKLWDLRNMMDPSGFQKMRGKNLSTGFDYRSDRYPSESAMQHPSDKSIVTYQGHSVHRTLIRCYFSPPTSTGSRYVYSGSANGKVNIYNVDATVAREVDVHAATSILRESALRRSYSWWGGYERDFTCVRDVSWHPTAPVFAATSFQGGDIGKGSVSVHSWRGADADLEPEEKEVRGRYKPKVYSTRMQPVSWKKLRAS